MRLLSDNDLQQSLSHQARMTYEDKFSFVAAGKKITDEVKGMIDEDMRCG